MTLPPGVTVTRGRSALGRARGSGTPPDFRGAASGLAPARGAARSARRGRQLGGLAAPLVPGEGARGRGGARAPLRTPRPQSPAQRGLLSARPLSPAPLCTPWRPPTCALRPRVLSAPSPVAPHLRPACSRPHSAGSSSSRHTSPAAAGPKRRQCAAGSSSAASSLAVCSVASTSARVLSMAAGGRGATETSPRRGKRRGKSAPGEARPRRAGGAGQGRAGRRHRRARDPGGGGRLGGPAPPLRCAPRPVSRGDPALLAVGSAAGGP